MVLNKAQDTKILKIRINIDKYKSMNHKIIINLPQQIETSAITTL